MTQQQKKSETSQEEKKQEKAQIPAIAPIHSGLFATFSQSFDGHSTSIAAPSIVFWGIGAIIVFLSYLLFSFFSVIFIIFASIVLSFALEGMIQKLSRILPRSVSIFVVYICLVLFLSIGFILFLPLVGGLMVTIGDAGATRLQTQRTTLTESSNGVFVSSFLSRLGIRNSDIFTTIQTQLQTIFPIIQNNITGIVGFIQQAGNGLTQVGSFAISTARSVAGGIAQGGMLFILSVLASREHTALFKLFSRVRPVAKGIHSGDYVLKTVRKKLGLWLESQFILCGIIFGCSLVGFALLSLIGFHVPNFLVLALIAGAFEIIPYIGPMLGGIPAVLVATIHLGRVGGIIVLAMMIILQQLENNVLVPWMMNRTVGLNPFLTFVMMILMGLSLGFLGVLLAIPVTIIVTVMYEERILSQKK